MAYGIFLPQRWRQQPQQRVEIDDGYPSAPTFRALVPGQGPLSTNEYAAVLNTRQAVGVAGKAWRWSGATSDAPSRQFYPTSGDFSAVLVAETTVAASNSQAVMYESDNFAANTYNGFGFGGNIREIHFGVLSNNWAFCGQRGTQTTASIVTIGAATQNVVACIGASISGSTIKTAIDGKAGGTLTDSGIGGSVAPNYYRFNDTGDTAAARYFRGNVYGFFVWQRALSDGELRNVTQNPWQLFRPIRSIIYSFPSGAIVPTLSSATVTDIGTTTVRPRVTVTF